jgi:glucosamine-6-phosphate deaminase
MMQEMKEMKVDKLIVKIYETRQQMGEQGAYEVSKKLKTLLAKQSFVNIIFAAAPSQNEFLAALSQQKGIDWERVNAFHMDEYIGLDNNDPERFGNFLRERIFAQVPFHEVHYLDGNANDIEAECRRYTDLLRRYPADIVCMGIGENAHVAFNDPNVADFNDPQMVKVVELEEASRQQQVHDDCFEKIDEVPNAAITLTVPSLMRAPYIFCFVPGSNKARAVYHTLNGKITENYPSTILRKHLHAILYLDKYSSEKL